MADKRKLYDHASSKEPEKKAAKDEREGEEKAVVRKAVDKAKESEGEKGYLGGDREPAERQNNPGDGAESSPQERHGKERDAMHMRHRTERRDAHGNYRTELDKMFSRHNKEIEDMHGRHAEELKVGLSGKTEEVAPPPETAVAGGEGEE